MNESEDARPNEANPAMAGENEPSAASAGPVPALEVLRDRVVRAVEEITRLRNVNAELADRVHHLEQLHGLSGAASSVVIDEDPQVLREKIAGYIKAIDAYLEEIDESQENGN